MIAIIRVSLFRQEWANFNLNFQYLVKNESFEKFGIYKKLFDISFSFEPVSGFTP